MLLLLRGGFLDGLMGSMFLVIGASLALISVSVIGLAWWIGTVMRPSSMWTVLGRAAIGAVGVGMLALGIFMAVVGGDASFGGPLNETIRNAVILLGWALGAQATFGELAISAAAMGRLATRHDSTLLASLSYFSGALGAAAWLFAKGLIALACFLFLAWIMRA